MFLTPAAQHSAVLHLAEQISRRLSTLKKSSAVLRVTLGSWLPLLCPRFRLGPHLREGFTKYFGTPVDCDPDGAFSSTSGCL
jgi:hypothetical protein